jgi:hypothetical protein
MRESSIARGHALTGRVWHRFHLLAVSCVAVACSGSGGLSPGNESSDASAGFDATSADGAALDAAPSDERLLEASVDGTTGTDAADREDAGPVDASGGSDSSAADAAPPFDGGGESVAIALDRTKSAGVVVPAMAGFSYEKAALVQPLFESSNTALVNLFKLLGPGILRVGGNTVDSTKWSAKGTGANVINETEVAALAGFLKAADWQVIYGINMKTNTAADATAEAVYAASVLGDRLYGFELGNETNLYKSTAESSTWSYAAFKTEWEQFEAAIHAQVPNAKFNGPASAGAVTTWPVPFAHDEASRINLLTMHYYRANGQLASSTLALLLSPDPSVPGQLTDLQKAATSNQIALGYRLAEANSFYNGGAAGVSDEYGAALWVIDFLFQNAKYGSAGVNFHGGGDGTGYTPIADKNGVVDGVRPDYYGMLFFSRVGSGPAYEASLTFHGATDAGAPNISAYAVGASDGATEVVVSNKSATAIDATVALGAPATSASYVLLTAPSLAATSGCTLGGVPVEISGTWTPKAPIAAWVEGSTLALEVPAGSAALVTVR